jgi:hypothetical protein
MRGLLISVSALVLIAACEGPTAVQEDLLAPEFAKVTIVRDGPISLTGRTTFAAYHSVSGEVVSDGSWNFLLAIAELRFEGGNKVVLHMTESFPTDPPEELRTLDWVGQLTPSGTLKLRVPADQVAAVEEHTGCTVSGTFPVYHGFFDGESLYASGHFHGICDGGTMWGPMLGLSEEGGPLHVTFAIELTTN